MNLPSMFVVRQKLPDRRIADIPSEVFRELREAGFASGLRPGARVAIGAGSRGIANIALILRAVVDYWKSEGMRPFIFPAMGSHGAATAAGQADVLAHYGIEEASMECPVVSQLDVVSLGRSEEGIEAFMDRAAYEADAAMLVGRVKWHTDFQGALESGLFKMMAIGLGKFAGAQIYHNYAHHIGLERVIRSVGRQVLKSGRVVGGVAILEDGHHQTAKLSALRSADMERREEELLALVKTWKARIPVERLDLLIVDEMGKNISGGGMDTKIVNRGVLADYNPWSGAPEVAKIFVRDLSDLSYGNGIGVGFADIVTDRLVAKIDWEPTLINARTSGSLASVRTPVHFATDRECLETAAVTVGRMDPKELQIGWIRDTLQLTRLALSEALLPEIQGKSDVEILCEPRPVQFDGDGNLVSLIDSADSAIA